MKSFRTLKSNCKFVSIATSLVLTLHPFQAFAQTQSDRLFIEFARRVANNFTQNCTKTVEVNYKSQELIAPDRRKSVYFEAITRNLGDRHANPRLTCDLRRSQTPVAKMIRTTDNQKQAIDFRAFLGNRYRLGNSATIINPVSWSANLRYLLIRLDSLKGYDISTTHLILDSENNYNPLNFHPDGEVIPCIDATGGSNFLGLSGSSAIFDCDEYGDPRYFESLNLQQSVPRRHNSLEKPTDLRTYGTINGLPEIQKVQQFPVR